MGFYIPSLQVVLTGEFEDGKKKKKKCSVVWGFNRNGLKTELMPEMAIWYAEISYATQRWQRSQNVKKFL